MLAKSITKPRELPKNEMTQSVCAFIVDCGQHEETELGTGRVSLKPKVMFVFEMEQKRSDGLPFILSQTFTNSLHEKANLSKFLEGWNGVKYSKEDRKNGIELNQFLNQNAYITPVHNNGYANIGSITKIREKDIPMKVTIQQWPKWVHDYIAKAKVPPAGYSKPADGASKAEGEDLPF